MSDLTGLTTQTSSPDPRAGALRIRETPLLRWALEIDGIGTALNGLAFLVAAGAVADFLGLSTSLLVPLGAFLLLYGAALIVMSARRRIAAVMVKAVVVVNVIWAVDSLVVAFTGWLDPSDIGTAYIILQAVVVAGFAVAQTAGMRRAAG